MRPVIRFLDSVDRENEEPEDSRQLTGLVARTATQTSVSDLRQSEQFQFSRPRPPTPPMERAVNIQFQKPKRLVDLVQKSLGASSARAAGSETFDYYVEQEGIDAP